MTRYTRSIPILAAVMVAAACSADDIVAPAVPATGASLSTTTVTATGPWASIVTGVAGKGAMYELRMPADWKTGDVVYYAHGFNDPTDELALPFKENIEATFNALGAMGYAVAASSFSENGFAVKDGVQRTHQLRGLFTAQFGEADRSYLMGHSLGGGIVVELAERYPEQYAGALAMCGMVGGSQLQIDYLGTVRAAFDAIYPGVLRGDAVNIPADLTRGEVEREAVRAMMGNPLGAMALTRLLPMPVEAPPGNPVAAIQGTAAALSFHVRGGRDVIDHTQGHNAFDNMTTVYTGGIAPFDGAFITGAIGRFAATPDARRYLAHWFEPSGDLQIPVLTLKTMWDPAVPNSHERKLAEVVEKAGRSANLRRNTGSMANPFNHCGFGTAEIVGNFQQLVTWVDSRN